MEKRLRDSLGVGLLLLRHPRLLLVAVGGQGRAFEIHRSLSVRRLGRLELHR